MSEISIIDTLIKWGINPLAAIFLVGNIIQYRTNSKLVDRYTSLEDKVLKLATFIVERMK